MHVPVRTIARVATRPRTVPRDPSRFREVAAPGVVRTYGTDPPQRLLGRGEYRRRLSEAWTEGVPSLSRYGPRLPRRDSVRVEGGLGPRVPLHRGLRAPRVQVPRDRKDALGFGHGRR